MINNLSFLEDSEADGGTDLNELNLMIQSLDHVDADIAKLEEQLKAKKEVRNKLAQEQIPQFLRSAGLSEIRLDDGRKVIVKEGINAKVTDRDKFMAFLRDRGQDDLAKTQIVMDKMPQEMRDELFVFLTGKNYPFSAKHDVHHTTLKAQVKRWLGIGLDEKKYADALSRGEIMTREQVASFLDVYTFFTTDLK